MRDQFQAMSARWGKRKAGIGRVQKLREELEQVNADIARAEQEYDLNKAAELKYGRLPELQKAACRSRAGRRGRRRAGFASARQGDGGGDSENRSPVDGHPGCQADGGRARKAAASAGCAAQARHWPERGRGKGERGHFAQPRGHCGRKPPHWQLFVPWANGCGQDRACQGAGGMSV